MQGVDMVFHLAALIGIPYSYESPLAYVKTNVEGTYNVLQAAKETGVSRVVHTSTSEVYGTAQYVPINEDHPLQAQSPYAATKIAADQLALSYYRSFGLPVVVVRPFNTYGPRQSARAIIPTIISQALRNEPPTVKIGDVKPIRDFNYVKDTVEGFISLAFCDRAVGEVVNLGTGKEISIDSLVDLIGKVLEVKINVVEDGDRFRPQSSEVYRLVCDNSKVLGLTTWRPIYALEEGLKETIGYIRDHLDLFKTSLYMI